ncbi:hypothetical protein BB560_000349 [Smittium megazygosporum]|uniref:CRAL-TRIO domain-containing protein n=1 Tax=Smittium megazygosporum TaxID=133381 RepID=A0A2T9ZKJ5_9FUNG|nr:hypothetical protein BB560_000349 [Smittium megazygosporum]
MAKGDLTLPERYELGQKDDSGLFFNLTDEEQKKFVEFWKLILPLLKEDHVLQYINSDTRGFGKSNLSTDPKPKDPLYSKVIREVSPQESLPPPAPQLETTSFDEIFFQLCSYVHPDSIVLKFLRARKWHLENALMMLKNTITWRGVNNIEELLWYGESELNLRIMEKGISFMAGVDRLGFPVLYCDLQLLIPSEISLKDFIKFIVYTMEMAMQSISVTHEKATVVIDVSKMGLKNIDWGFFKNFLKILTDCYPECLASVLIYSNSLFFRGIWATVKPLLDPVVASKVHFTPQPSDLLKFIDKEQLAEKYKGSNPIVYKYLTPEPNENALMFNSVDAEATKEKFKQACIDFVECTSKWVNSPDPASPELKKARDSAIDNFLDSGKAYSPYYCAKTIYHRTGGFQ